MHVRERAKLLISVHDVSPLTLEPARDAVALLHDAGVPAAAITILAVPFHHGQVLLSDHEPTVRYLHELVADGATLVSHGYTHRMTGNVGPRPLRWLKARWFARGEGELLITRTADSTLRMDAAAAIFGAAKLEPYGFVPPAWLLSPDAERIARARYEFVETFGGIAIRGKPGRYARRLVGWGALTAIEARATCAHAWIQARRRPADTRLAIHPPDLARRSTRGSLVRTLRRLLTSFDPINYQRYVEAAR